MNGTDNIAGYSLTVGTADMVITDSIAQYDPIIGNVTNGAAVNYKIQFIDPAMSEDYETGTGTYNSGITTISRGTVKTSSNGGALVDFGAGPKVVFLVDDYASIQSMGTKYETATAKVMTDVERDTIAGLGDSSSLDVGTVAGTVAAGNDSRFGSVDIGDLTPATSIDGTELVPADQAGDGVSITTQQILADPVRAVRTLAMDRVQGYTNFNGLQYIYTNATDGTVAQLEKFLINRGGVGAQAFNGSFITAVPSLTITTGTDTTGYCSATHLEYPIGFDPAKELDQTWSLYHNDLPSGGQASTTQVGFLLGAPALATQGMYFYLDDASNSWYYAVKDAGGTTSASTTVTASSTFTAPQALRIHYDPSGTPSTKFYIDGTLRGTVTNATRVVGTNQALAMGYSIRKSSGTTARTLSAYAHAFNIERAALANF